MVNTCLGYASRLSAYPHKGVTGLPEREDSKRVLNTKLKRLVELVTAAERVVVLTGAGISTSAGIPDFRGPRGIWTLEDAAKKGKKQRRSRDADVSEASFESAVPTPTHFALVALSAAKVTWCATQNVDGLHLSSGFPRAKLAILHGCVFTEKCLKCGKEYVRDRDVGGISFQPTGRSCDDPCGGVLVDTVLDWEDDLPEDEWQATEAEFNRADLCICLGTSLRITPAAELPLKAKRFVIVNLQETPYDRKATLVIKARVDAVMEHLLLQLGIALPTAPPPNDELEAAAS